MLTRIAIAFLVAAILTACRPLGFSLQIYTPTPTPAATPPVVRAYTQFAAGDTLDLVQTQLGLDNYEVRYRSSMPEGQMGMVYFLDDGNLHIDAKKIGDTWVILSVPLLEPSAIPAADRVAELGPLRRRAKDSLAKRPVKNFDFTRFIGSGFLPLVCQAISVRQSIHERDHF